MIKLSQAVEEAAHGTKHDRHTVAQFTKIANTVLEDGGTAEQAIQEVNEQTRGAFPTEWAAADLVNNTIRQIFSNTAENTAFTPDPTSSAKTNSYITARGITLHFTEGESAPAMP